MRCRRFAPASWNARAARMSASSSARSPASNACSRARAAVPNPISRPCAASASISASPSRPDLTWAVNAPTSRLGRGELAGTYGGVGANASVGVGGGGNFLVGGPRQCLRAAADQRAGPDRAERRGRHRRPRTGAGRLRPSRLAGIIAAITADTIAMHESPRGPRKRACFCLARWRRRCAIESGAPRAWRLVPRRITSFNRRFLHAPLIHPCRARRRHAGRIHRRRPAPAARVQVGVLECRGGASVGFIVGSVTNLGCVLRVDGMPEDRYVATIRKVGLDLGITQESALAWGVLRRSRGSGRAISPATMPARRAAPRSASASAAMCWSAAPPIRSRCSRSACRARSASISPPGWKAWNCGRDVNRVRSSVIASSESRECASDDRLRERFADSPSTSLAE